MPANTDHQDQHINHDHLPRLEILFRLTARMPTEGSQPVDQDGYLAEELLHEFHRLPDDWKPEAVNQLRLLLRLSTQPPELHP
jgi:hypothetical protein